MSELLTRTRAVMRLKHYDYKTEKIYVYWMKKYFYFHINKSVSATAKAAKIAPRFYQKNWSNRSNGNQPSRKKFTIRRLSLG